MTQKKKITLQMIADELQLSLHTVSKALRGLPGMSEETRHEVAVAARRLGYRTKAQLHSLNVDHIPLYPLNKRRFKLIVTSDASASRLNQLLLQGVQEKLAEHGHTGEMVMLPPALNSQAAVELWAEQHDLAFADGLFLLPMILPQVEQMLLHLPLPRILFNFPPADDPEVDCVIWDIEGAVRQSVRHLLDNGHRRIVYIGNTSRFRGFGLRWEAFSDTMREAGLPVSPEQHITAGFSGKGSWVRNVQKHLADSDATAILNGVHQHAAWIYHVCSSIGKSIPRDLSLVSIQHEEDAFVPQLSRPVLPIYETGMRGAERMLWRLANPSQPYEHIYLQGTFVNGNTVRQIRADRSARSQKDRAK
jgi:LacI family transcriptional regulator